MAKKKQKKKENNSGFKYPIEIKGIIFIVIAIIGFWDLKQIFLERLSKDLQCF